MKGKGFTGIRKVPRKTRFIGDRAACQRLVGEAESQLRILENAMSFRGLSQGRRKLKGKNFTIECWSCFTLQGVIITATAVGGKVEKDEFEAYVPLVASGLCIHDETLEEYTGKTLLFYEEQAEKFISCTPYTPHYMLADYTFFQVKFARQVSYYAGNTKRRNIATTLSVGKSTLSLNTVMITIEQFIEPRQDLLDPEAVDETSEDGDYTYSTKPNVHVTKFVKTWNQNDPDTHLTFFTANLNETKDRLYVAYGYNTDGIYIDPLADPADEPAQVNTELYIRHIDGDTGKIEWLLQTSRSFESSDWFMGHGFVDNQGFLHGLYYASNGPHGDTTYRHYYAKINLEDSNDIVLTDIGCQGYTVYDGEFQGIFIKHTVTVLDAIIPTQFVYEPSPPGGLYLQHRAFQYPGFDDIYLEFLYHEGNWGYMWFPTPPTEPAYPFRPYTESFADPALATAPSIDDTQEYRQVYYSVLTDPWLNTYSYDECKFGDIDYMTGITGSEGYSWRKLHKVSSNIFDLDFDMWEDNKVESFSVVGGTISLYSNNEKFESKGSARTDGNVGGTCYINGEAADCSLIHTGWSRLNEDNDPPTGGPHRWLYFEGTQPVDVSRGEVFDTQWPFSFQDHVGLSSFIAWDASEEGGLVIKGMRYRTEPDDSNVHLRVDVNDVDVTDDLLSCTGFDKDDFYYLGFLY